MYMLKPFRILPLLLALCALVAGCSSASAKEIAVIGSESSVVSSWVTEEVPDQNVFAFDASPEVMPVGGARHALVRIDMPWGISDKALDKAYLCLLQSGGETPKLTISPINMVWSYGNVTWQDSLGTDGFRDAASDADAQKNGDWVKIDVTAYVKGVLSGERPNYGLVLSQAEGESTFYSAFASDEALLPKLEIAYDKAEAEEVFGQYEYTAQEFGNCLSFALRDTSGIYYDALFTQADTAPFQKAYDEGGVNTALQFVKEKVFAYIDNNLQSLNIASYREIDAYDAPVDPDTEYRVCLRVGFRDRSFPEGIQVDQDFDYHLKAQTRDGTWAEKTPGEASRIVPGTHAGVNPALFPWDESYLWGYEKWNDFYDSDAVWFAVSKAGEGFTEHKPVEE
ncbi:hypothetical protein FACS1894196_0850 [Clostridia bacterium]|nr:hypothetical protein FACS1894196_0850 [Clostridia bacterium]